MQKEIIQFAQEFLNTSHADAVAIAFVNFKNHSFEHFEWHKNEGLNEEESEIFFDLASITKPLVNGLSFIAEDIQDKELELLVNHRAGLPAWGLLEKKNWREQLESYKIHESKTLYSDFSALRYMIDLEKKKGIKLEETYRKHLDSNILYWKDLTDQKVLQNGYYKKQPNIGRVHDPNAYNVKGFTSHAGLFGTVDGLARTLLSFHKRFDLIGKFDNKFTQRFQYGFDTVENTKNTLAGSGCSENTFGHLGFTGTSFWIDARRGVGHIILSNATKHYWYDKRELNILRKRIGEYLWKSV